MREAMNRDRLMKQLAMKNTMIVRNDTVTTAVPMLTSTESFIPVSFNTSGLPKMAVLINDSEKDTNVVPLVISNDSDSLVSSVPTIVEGETVKTVTSALPEVATTSLPLISTGHTAEAVTSNQIFVSETMTTMPDVVTSTPMMINLAPTTLSPMTVLESVRQRIDQERAAMFLEKSVPVVTESSRNRKQNRAPYISTTGRVTMSSDLTAMHKAMEENRKIFRAKWLKENIEKKEASQFEDLYRQSVTNTPQLVTVPTLPVNISTVIPTPATDHNRLVTVNSLVENTSDRNAAIMIDLSSGMGWLTLVGFVGSGKCDFLL